MEVGNPRPRGLSILCIDGGGVRGLSSLMIIKELMYRLREPGNDRPQKPMDYFDVIAGTGTGGVIACMLGRLQMPIDEAIAAYEKLMEGVFSDKKAWASRESGEAYKETKLEESLQSMVRKITGNDRERILDERAGTGRCRTMVFAMMKHHMTGSKPIIFRSYEAEANPGPDCAIWKALYATMAHPDLFKSIEINDGLSVVPLSFVGGELGCSNPTNHVLREVKRIYPNQHVSCILSIGAGHTRTIQIPDPSRSQWVLRSSAITAMKDMAVDGEHVAEEMATRFEGMTGVYYRFNVDQGTQSVAVGDWEKRSELAAHTKAYMMMKEPDRRMDQAVRAIQARENTVATIDIDGQIPAASRTKGIRVKHCPAPTPVFTGRNDLVTRLGASIASETDERQVCVVYGLGGAGKTQLALKTIEQNRDKWSYIVFVDASSDQAIQNMLQSFAEAQQIGTAHKDAIHWLETCPERWLLFFDNADDLLVDLRKYFPAGNRGSILITTRLKNLVQLARGPSSTPQIRVPPNLDSQESLALLLKAACIQRQELSGSEMEAATALVQDLGYLPLAIVQAGAYICYSDMTISRYRHLFLINHQRALEEYNKLPTKIDDYKKTVYTTWRMCYNLLGPDSKSMLWLITFLHHDTITETVFERAAVGLQSYKPEIPLTGLEASGHSYIRQYLSKFLDLDGRWGFRFSHVIRELSSRSLINFDRVNQAYSVHVLVQDWARTMIQPEPHYRLALECTSVLLVLSVDYDDVEDSKNFLRELKLHIDKILSEHDSASGNTKSRFAKVYKEMKHWARAVRLEEEVLEIRKKALGGEHPYTLTSINNLATIYRNQGRWDEAEPLCVQVLDSRKRLLGEEHPDTLASMSNLVSIYQKQNRWNEAGLLCAQVLDTQKRLLGDEHLNTLITMGNLAFTYKKQRRWGEAEILCVRVLDAHKRLHGQEHQHTLNSMNNLALTYQQQGRWDEAEVLCVRVLDVRKRVLGEDHPDTLASMNNLTLIHQNRGQRLRDEAKPLRVNPLYARNRALSESPQSSLTSVDDLMSMYQEQGRWDKAEPLCARVLDTRKRLLGDDHPETLSIMNNLALIYQNQGRQDKAEPLYVQLLDARKRLLGEYHPDTLIIMDNLALMYYNQGRQGEAEPLCVQVLDARLRLFGKEHTETLNSMNNLALIYHSQGRQDEAALLCEQVLDARLRLLGNDHPDTLASMHDLVLMHQKRGRWDEAALLCEGVLNAHKRLLGDDDPDTLTSMNNLALIYQNQGRQDRAELLYVQLLDARKRLHGDDDPDTLIIMNNLALIYCNQGRQAEAEPLYAQVLATRRRLLGEEHPDTLGSMHDLVLAYQKLGRWDDAKALCVQVLDKHKQLLGREHPHTLASMNNLALSYLRQGRCKKAESLCVQVIDASKRQLDDDDPDMLTIRTNLALVYQEMGRWSDAEFQCVQVLNARKRVLGEEHPDTLAIMQDLVWTYWNQGRLHDSGSLCAKVLDARKRILGEEHPDTLTTMRCLAWVHWKQSQFDEAEALLIQLVAVQERTIGLEHPRMLEAKQDLEVVQSSKAAERRAREHEKMERQFYVSMSVLCILLGLLFHDDITFIALMYTFCWWLALD